MNKSRRLIELYDNYVDDTLTSAQSSELTALLAHTELQKEWRMLSYLEAKLQEEMGIAQHAGALADEPVYAEQVSQQAMPWAKRFAQRTGWWAASFALHAACLFLAALWIIFVPEKPDQEAFINMDIQPVQGSGYTNRWRVGIRNSELPESQTYGSPDEFKPSKDDIPYFEFPEDIEKRYRQAQLEEIIGFKHIEQQDWFPEEVAFFHTEGSFSNRFRAGRKRALARFGGSHETEEAVYRTLGWFKRHQAADGSWSFFTYQDNCKDIPQCAHFKEGLEKRKNHIGNEKNGATGFAVLCYLGAGHTHKAGRFRNQVADGLAYLKKHQKENGSFSPANYVHAVTTMAVSEAYGMTKEAALKETAQKAVNVLLQRQNQGMGWDYSHATGRNDTSVTGWCVMALKSAKSAGLDIGNAFEGAGSFMDKITPAVRGDVNPVLSDHCRYEFASRPDAPRMSQHENPTLTSISLLTRVFIGQNTRGKILRAHANMLLKEKPKLIDPEKTVSWWDSACYYQWYYSTLAMFQMGGTYWRTWNDAMKSSLLKLQNKGGCEDGSWEPISRRGSRAGRIYSTAVNCLSLEVYYRYLPILQRINQ
jgi:hypothetical protein